jgi:hypothetical protein
MASQILNYTTGLRRLWTPVSEEGKGPDTSNTELWSKNHIDENI